MSGDDPSLQLLAPRRIKALAQDVVNKIAAGEVIVAPVHALKELTENAVDAGSTSIEILVKDGGLKLLQITDNGSGINKDDLPILCERFTTSKLKSFEDLASIGTYGFRGEALASISHIAHLRVTTRTKESSCAWQAHYADGRLTAPKPGQAADPKACAGRQGTQITVEDLFYNIPTRRKAFRSASEEYSKILDLIGRYAIHCTGVAFTCKKHGDAAMGVTVQQGASTVDRIRNIHGSAVANELIKFDTTSDQWGFKANGWVSNANYHVKRLILLLFINHRSVESSTIRKAVEQTYSVFLPKGSHPFVYLSLEIEPHRVDVNIHPTKREVHFLHEDEIVNNICEEIRTRLGNVDTSRTFMTQSLLPGVRIPTISAETLATPRKSSNLIGLSTPTMNSTQKTPRTQSQSQRPYENNLVRTDTNLRKITSMLPPSQRPTPKQSSLETNQNLTEADIIPPPMLRHHSSMTYVESDKQHNVCRLSSIKNLRNAVREVMLVSLTETITAHTFVGIVDVRRRIAAIQSGVRLLLVDYGMLSNEFFYQVGLTDFGNFGSIRLDPPLSLDEVLKIGAKREKEIAEDPEELDWDEVIQTVSKHLIHRREMLHEYFSLEMSQDGLLLGLPLLIKGYTPSMAKLPRFLLRLGPHVNWGDEEACFKSFLRELASWYTPEALPSRLVRYETRIPNESEKDEDVVMQDGEASKSSKASNGKEAEDSMNNAENINEDEVEMNEDPSITARRNELENAVENVLFPAFKARLIGTKGMAKGVVEIANLKGLYKVFERC